MSRVDVVVVAYNSREELRACVEPLAGVSAVNVTVVDNASPDRSLDAVAGLPVAGVQLDENRGFAHGCNAGWRPGDAPYVLFLNPDARIGVASLRRLAQLLDDDESVGIAAPRIVDPEGTLQFSQRRDPRLRSLFAQALYLHRLFPRAPWTDELVRAAETYAKPGSPDWASGACLLVRRSALERTNGFDEGFFMYWEDADLCRRVRDLGLDVRYEPEAVVEHVGGASRPRAELLPTLAASRVLYARKHSGPALVAVTRLGLALGALTHVIAARGGTAARAGHARSLRTIVGGGGA